MSLTSFKNFKKECLKFGEPVEDKHGGTRINLSYNDDTLYLSSPTLFSFGVQESVFKKKKIGYQIPLCLHSKDDPTPDEVKFSKCLKDIQSKCHYYLKKNFSPDVSEHLSEIIYGKSSSPILYLKLDWHTKKDKILTLLRTKEKESALLLKWMQDYCKVVTAISFKSIYIGENSVSIQVRAEEIYFKPLPKKEKKPMLVVEDSDEEESGEEEESDEEEEEK